MDHRKEHNNHKRRRHHHHHHHHHHRHDSDESSSSHDSQSQPSSSQKSRLSDSSELSSQSGPSKAKSSQAGSSRSSSSHISSQHIPPPYRKNFKLLVDPMLKKGATKLYRIEGRVVGDQHCSVTVMKDPRSSLTKIWARVLVDLPVPKFKIDEFYVGEPPKVEIGITNLDDNIQLSFLVNLIEKYGETEELIIFHHPETNKHLGVARVVFVEADHSAACIAALHGRPVMGKRLNVFLDPFGKLCNGIVEALISPGTKEFPILPPLPPPLPQSDDDAKDPIETQSNLAASTDDQAQADVSSPTDKTAESETETDPPIFEATYPSLTPPVEPIPLYPQMQASHLQFYQYPPPPLGGWPAYPWDVEQSVAPLPDAPPIPGPYPNVWAPVQSAPIQEPPPRGVLHQHLLGEPPNELPPQNILPAPLVWTPWSLSYQHFSRSPGSPLPGDPQLPPRDRETPDRNRSLLWTGVDNNVPAFFNTFNGAPQNIENAHNSCINNTPPLDLDSRIELLLTGATGEVPTVVNVSKALKKPSTFPAGNLPPLPDGEEPLPPPLPLEEAPPLPSEDEPPRPLPPSSLGSTTPPILDADPDRYKTLTTPPSPFLSEEAYFENLLIFRLKHLNRFEQEAKDPGDSSGDENPKNDVTQNDDDMSLSSLSSNNENIEEQTFTSETHFPTPEPSVTTERKNILDAQFSFPPACVNFNSMVPPFHISQIPSNNWTNVQWPNLPPPPPPPRGRLMNPNMHMRIPIYATPRRPRSLSKWVRNDPYQSFPRFRGPRMHQFISKTTDVQPAVDRVQSAINEVFDNICNLVKEKLEKDVMKKFTEVVAYNELDKWWDREEKKHKVEHEVVGKIEEQKDVKSTTTESLLNAIIDSSYDSFPLNTCGLGLRAALPKMPSFKRKMASSAPKDEGESPQRKDEAANESDQEEMVQVSDTDDDDEIIKSEAKPIAQSRKRAVSTSSSSSSSSSQSSSQSAAASPTHSDSESDDSSTETRVTETEKPKDSESPRKKEKKNGYNFMFYDFPSYSDSEDLSGPPKTPDIHLSDTESVGVPRTPSPSGGHLDDPSTNLFTFPTDFDIEYKDSNMIVRTPSPTKSFPDDIFGEDQLYLLGNDTCHVAKKLKSDIDKKKSKKRSSKMATEEKLSSNCQVKQDSHSNKHYDNLIDRKSIKKHKEKKKRPFTSSKECLKSLDEEKIEIRNIEYTPRDAVQEANVCYKFLIDGLDSEDENYLKNGYYQLLADENQTWLNDTHWVDSNANRCGSNLVSYHSTGCARAEGYYKIDPIAKLKYKHHHNKNRPIATTTLSEQTPPENKAQLTASREARSNQRRMLTILGTESDLLKFNQLKFRKKQLKFGKSDIHDWGLFAMEPIAAAEMVIEYVGQAVRPFLADYREEIFKKRGIGSSYLFRIDDETIIDATKSGNLARLINHSCDPNCSAKVITIEGQKKIVIYSRRDIKIHEEITYDYKFPLEEEKIRCLCASSHCKGFLN